MTLDKVSIIVPGGLNTDIIGKGVSTIVGKGELSYGGTLSIGPGGKSRNIAQMIGALIDPEKVAMIGKTSKDPYGLWEPPVSALQNCGINTEFIKILDYKVTGKFPGIALIPVDTNGNNQIYVLPGINEDFSPSDIDDAKEAFAAAKKNNGILALSLELPLPTAMRAIELAETYNLKTILDVGGINPEVNYDALLSKKIYLIKANEHEATILTGQRIVRLETARSAARVFLKKGIEHVVITAGKEGAYYFTRNKGLHIPIPKIQDSTIKDETGCGDQAMAAICAYIDKGVKEAVKIGITAGTLQFYRQGIQPVTRKELHDVCEYIA